MCYLGVKTAPSILIYLDTFVVINKICISNLALIFSIWGAEESWKTLRKSLRTFSKALCNLVAYPTGLCCHYTSGIVRLGPMRWFHSCLKLHIFRKDMVLKH